MQKRDSICVSSSVFSYFVIKYSHFKMFRKSENENTIQWAIHLASLSYQSIFCSQMSVSEIRNNVCFGVNIQIMTQDCWNIATIKSSF